MTSPYPAPLQRELTFDGPDLTLADNVRLSAQHWRVLRCLRAAARVAGSWLTLGEIHDETGDPEASISARIRDFRKERFGKFNVQKRRRAGHVGLYEYRMVLP